MIVSPNARGLHPYPVFTTGRMRSVGELNSFIRSCDQSTLPVRLSKACSCLLVPNVKTRSPTTSGVECGPAPKLKSSIFEGYLCSQIVLPDAASSATTDSSALHGP